MLTFGKTLEELSECIRFYEEYAYLKDTPQFNLMMSKAKLQKLQKVASETKVEIDLLQSEIKRIERNND